MLALVMFRIHLIAQVPMVSVGVFQLWTKKQGI